MKHTAPKPAREGKFTQESLLKSAAARIAQKLKETQAARQDPVPPGWFTAEQLAQGMGLDTETVRRQMRQIQAPAKKFRKSLGSGLRQVTHYKP